MFCHLQLCGTIPWLEVPHILTFSFSVLTRNGWPLCLHGPHLVFPLPRMSWPKLLLTNIDCSVSFTFYNFLTLLGDCLSPQHLFYTRKYPLRAALGMACSSWVYMHALPGHVLQMYKQKKVLVALSWHVVKVLQKSCDTYSLLNHLELFLWEEMIKYLQMAKVQCTWRICLALQKLFSQPHTLCLVISIHVVRL